MDKRWSADERQEVVREQKCYIYRSGARSRCVTAFWLAQSSNCGKVSFRKRNVRSFGFEENVRNVLGLAVKFLPLVRNLVLLHYSFLPLPREQSGATAQIRKCSPANLYRRFSITTRLGIFPESCRMVISHFVSQRHKVYSIFSDLWT